MPRRASTTPSEVAPKLIDCVSTQGPQLSASLERWVADYSRDAPAAIAELLSFLVQASGLPGAKLDLDSVHGEAEDGLTDLLTDQTCAELVENAKQLARRAATANSTSPSPPHAFLLPPSHHTLPPTTTPTPAEADMSEPALLRALLGADEIDTLIALAAEVAAADGDGPGGTGTVHLYY